MNKKYSFDRLSFPSSQHPTSSYLVGIWPNTVAHRSEINGMPTDPQKMVKKIKNFLSYFIILFLCINSNHSTAHDLDFLPNELSPFVATAFAGGNGTAASPYQITNWTQLDQVRFHLNSHFTLLNDLDGGSAGYAELASFGANNGEGWMPIGGLGTEFTGRFDGVGHVIKDLNIFRDITSGTGLFGVVKDAEIRNLGIVDGEVESYGIVGLLAGSASNTDFDGVFSTGQVRSLDGQVRVGGLIGNMGSASLLKFSFSSAEVEGESDSGSVIVGGLVGSLSGTISDSYSAGSVYGSSWSNSNIVVVGGLVGRGFLSNNSIIRCFSASRVGGFTFQSSKLSRGGLVGLTDAGFSVQQSFWDINISEQSSSAGGTGAIGKITDELKFEVNFIGWNFSETGPWRILNSAEGGRISYPYLQRFKYDELEASITVNPLPGAEIFYFEGGFGTLDNPYQISNWIQLHAIRQKMAGNFVLINDLDQNTEGYAEHASASANNGQGWQPIGLDGFGNKFAGSFDGAGFYLKGLHQNRIAPSDYAGGLFGIVARGIFKNLGIIDAKIISRGSAGILAAEVGLDPFDSNVSIENVFTTGSVESVNGFSRAGGIVGMMGANSVLEKSFSTAKVRGSTIDFRDVRSGGLVGDLAGSIIDCFSIGEVSSEGFDFAFGIAAGGLVGRAAGRISNSYSSGKVTALSASGGVFEGGLIGFTISTTIENSFWDQETSLQSLGSSGVRKTTAEMKNQATFIDWDFTLNTGVWKIQKAEDGFISYPYLAMLPFDVPLATPVNLPIPGLEIIMRPQAISFGEIESKTYGDAPFVLGDAKTDMGLDVVYVAADTAVLSIVGNMATILKVGSTDITASQEGNLQFFPADVVTRVLTVTKAPLLITSEDKSIVYGGVDPDFSVVYEGFVLNESKANLTGVLAFEREMGVVVGSYSILPKGLSSQNYEITFKAGKLTITKANLTLTLENSQKIYGDPNPAFTFTYTGLVNGDVKIMAEPSIASTAILMSAVGNYPITLTGGEDPNYEIKLVDGVLTINPAKLSIQANSQSKVFGTADPVLTYLSTGWKGSDTADILTGKLEREGGELIGKYAIQLGTIKANNNYELIFASDIMEILPAILSSLKAMEQVKTPWSIKPVLPVKIVGLTQEGNEFELDVIWDESKIDLFKRGAYPIVGVLILPAELVNPKSLVGGLVVVVLEKQAPDDIILSQDSFDPDPEEFYQEIGEFTVIDSSDQIHFISLIPGELSNKYFEILDGKLFWNSEEKFELKKEFEIKIRVEDRDGNIIEKIFTIIRKRMRANKGAFLEPEIYNSFTPDGDGKNDTWGVADLEYFPDIRVEVFDRNGKLVFFTEDEVKRWDATVDGKMVPVGTYFWVSKDKISGEIKRGYLTIIRK